MTSIILTIVIIYLGVLVLMYVAQRSLMYQPGKALPPPSQTQIPNADPQTLTTPDGLDLVSWYLPPSNDMPVVVYFQGNAATIADRDFKIAPWQREGYGAWLVGYRGFGGNPGSPTEDGLYTDARTALAALSDRGIGPGQIILYGESLGSGVATHMAKEMADQGTPVRGLVLEAPFTSMGDAAQDHYPFLPARWLVKDAYDSLTKISGIKTPLLIVHGDRDRVVRQQHGRKLFASAKRPKTALWIKGAAHNDLYDFGAGNQIMRFFSNLNKG